LSPTSLPENGKEEEVGKLALSIFTGLKGAKFGYLNYERM
jgi:hypothetical protein